MGSTLSHSLILRICLGSNWNAGYLLSGAYLQISTRPFTGGRSFKLRKETRDDKLADKGFADERLLARKGWKRTHSKWMREEEQTTWINSIVASLSVRLMSPFNKRMAWDSFFRICQPIHHFSLDDVWDCRNLRHVRRRLESKKAATRQGSDPSFLFPIVSKGVCHSLHFVTITGRKKTTWPLYSRDNFFPRQFLCPTRATITHP